MPLSEEELRLLEQMERALVAEDPKFASALRGTALRRNARRRAYVAAGTFLAGIVVLMTGAVMRITIVGIIGFVVMLASSYVALSAWRRQGSAPTGDSGNDRSDPGDEPFGLSVIEGGRASKRPARGHDRNRHSMMERLEQRWRRRRDQNGGF